MTQSRELIPASFGGLRDSPGRALSPPTQAYGPDPLAPGFADEIREHTSLPTVADYEPDAILLDLNQVNPR